MKKILLLLYFAFCILNAAFSQTPGQWTWMNGDSASPAPAYGTQGVPSAANKPMALYEAIQWTDTNGNFWLYGGVSDVGPQPEQADLWKFIPSLNQWEWVKGPGDDTINTLPFYGTKGFATAANTPGSRGWGAASWVDNNGDLWLFGGANYTGFFSDLWKYHIATNEWTWMAGPKTYNNAGIYGTEGQSNAGNNPGSRQETDASWTDNGGNLWLFGGDGYDGLGNQDYLNDLWKYDVTLNEWAWMNGSFTGNVYGNYGTEGVPNDSNVPSARWCYAKWKDKAGNFWMFGGEGFGYDYGFKSLGELNDLWMYNVSTNIWTWMSGTDSLSSMGAWGASCTLSMANYPSGRFENRSCWTDACGNFWMFGGHQINGADQNNLWYYNPTLNQWGWTGDMTSPADYGTKEISSSTNQPLARGGGLGWMDKSGNLWMGEGWSIPAGLYYNDLWRFVPDSSCNHCGVVTLPPPVASFQSTDSVLCTGDCINFTDLSTNSPTSWLWTFNGGTPSSSILPNPQGICYQSTGSFGVTLVVSNNGGVDSASYDNFITINASPPTPVINQSGDSLLCSTDSSYTSYQWFYNDTIIAGATDTFYVATQNGNYNVKVTNRYGCYVATGINVVLNGMKQFTVYGLQFTVYPNPAGDELIIETQTEENGSLAIYNLLGEKVKEEKLKLDSNVIVNIKDLSPGIYFVQLKTDKQSQVERFVKQ